MIMTIHDALESLHPTAEWVVRGDTLEWLDENVTAPTQVQIDTEIARLQTEYDGLAYARTRAAAYPADADFKEAWTEKEIGSDSTKWDAYVIAYNKVRTDNPK
jgi:hypothetical protein